MNTCSGCSFYSVNPQHLKEGHCRVNPPVTFAVPSPKGIVVQAFDPGVGAERLACDKFKPK